MAKKTNLREFQRGLMARLNALGDTTPVSSKLGFQAGRDNWLVDLTAVSEVVPSPVFAPLPLTRHWFCGLSNVRGNLYSIVDFSAFIGGPPTHVAPECRLLLVGTHLVRNTGLLVSRMVGLRNPDQFKLRQDGDGTVPWVRATYIDAAGELWTELDVAALVHVDSFLDVGV